MIRRVAEYVIVCDSERVLGYQRCEAYGYAFSSVTLADCATSASREGWQQVSKRLWLCPRCADARVHLGATTTKGNQP